jgi:hypothetical protein
MYVEIDAPQFLNVDPLQKGVSTYLSLPAIIKGTSSGRIWVDDYTNPCSALVWDLANGFLFVLGKLNGDTDSSELNVFLKKQVLPMAKKAEYTTLCMIVLSEVDEPQLHRLIKDLSWKIKDMYRFCIKDGADINELDTAIPPAYHLVRINRKMLDNEGITNVEEVRRCIMACWHDIEDYFQDGIGYALLTDDTVVSWCSTDYVSSNVCDLYVETFDSHTHRGFGTVVALACVKECLNQHYEVNWHCWHDNVGSIRIAEKIGFSHKATQRVYSITL